MVGKIGAGDIGGSHRRKLTAEEVTELYGSTGTEARRLAILLGRDRAYARAERKRETAEFEIENGKFDNLGDTTVYPTPEQLAHGEFEPFTADKTEGTVRQTSGMRRVSPARILNLYQRGVLTDDTYPAALWYRRQWELSGLMISTSAAAWGEFIAGQPVYGHLPKTPIEAEARHNFRFGRGFIPVDMAGLFDAVVLDERTITEAARVAKCRYTNVTVALQLAAVRLAGGIAHLLPVRAVGAPGSEPGVTSEETSDDISDATVAAVFDAGDGFDPEFLDDAGMLRPWAEISEIIRGRLAEPTIEDDGAS